MSDVNETLRNLLARRIWELGVARTGEPYTLHEWHQKCVPRDAVGAYAVSYETFRQIWTGTHSGKINDRTAEVMAAALEVDVNEIYAAAGQRPRLGPFELPGRADQLDDQQRKVILSVIDTILSAAGGGEAGAGTPEPTPIRPAGPSRREQMQTVTPAAARRNPGKKKLGDDQ